MGEFRRGKIILQTTMEPGSYSNDEIGSSRKVQLEFSALLGPLARVVGSVEFVPLDLVGCHVYEVQAFSIWKMLIVKPLRRWPCDTGVTDDYVGHETLWQYWPGGENEQF
jgi:hypothetical protein